MKSGHDRQNGTRAPSPARRLRLTQEGIIVTITVVMFGAFAVFLPGFLSVGNLLTLLRSVSVLGILSVGMGVVVISRGIDLSMVATLAMGTAVAVVLAQPNPWFPQGLPFWQGALLGLLFVLIVTSATGLIIAYADLPAVFATLAMGYVIYGLGRSLFLSGEANYLPDDAGWVVYLGRGLFHGIPVSILCFIAVLVITEIILRKTAFGLFVYAMGDNPVAARSAGVPVRPITVVIYVFAGLVAYFAGLLTAGAVNNINTRIFNSTLIYDVLMVVVVGGIGLSGGKGSMKNVVLGTLLIGTLLNGMIIMNVSYIQQNLIKGVILLAAILADTIFNPRDEQTSQQGDI